MRSFTEEIYIEGFIVGYVPSFTGSFAKSFLDNFHNNTLTCYQIYSIGWQIALKKSHI